MAELTVENLHLHVRRQPDPEGRVDDAATAARWCRCSARRAAARRRCCARSPASRCRTRARSASATRSVFDGARGIDVPAEARNLGPRVPVVRAVAAQDGVRQRRLRPEAAQASAAPTIAARVHDGARRNSRPRPPRRALSAPAVGRPAAARRARARAGLQPAGDPARRAAVEPRRQAARGSARLAARADRAHAAVGAVRDARPGRGAGDVRPHPAAQRRPDRAAGHAASRCTARRETLFTAEFMGSNNRLPGRVAEMRDGARAARRRRLAAVGRRARRGAASRRRRRPA